MPAVAFDTLKLAQRLEAAGLPQGQAQQMASALAETIGESIVTRGHLDLRLAELRADLRTDIAGLRADLRTDIADLRAELIKWAVGIGIAGVVVIGGMILSATLALPRAVAHG